MENKPSFNLQDFYLKIVREWKHFWMNQTQNSEEDHRNYFNRAFGIDANMMHHLADKLAVQSPKALEQANLKIQELLDAGNAFQARNIQLQQDVESAQARIAELEHENIKLRRNSIDWHDIKLDLEARIAELEAENEFLQADGVHTCSNQCKRHTCVQRREIEALKSENERLNKYVIAGHQQIEAEMKSEIERLAKQNESLTIERDYWKQEYQHESENRAAMMIERDQYKTALEEILIIHNNESTKTTCCQMADVASEALKSGASCEN